LFRTDRTLNRTLRFPIFDAAICVLFVPKVSQKPLSVSSRRPFRHKTGLFENSASTSNPVFVNLASGLTTEPFSYYNEARLLFRDLKQRTSMLEK